MFPIHPDTSYDPRQSRNILNLRKCWRHHIRTSSRALFSLAAIFSRPFDTTYFINSSGTQTFARPAECAHKHRQIPYYSLTTANVWYFFFRNVLAIALLTNLIFKTIIKRWNHRNNVRKCQTLSVKTRELLNHSKCVESWLVGGGQGYHSQQLYAMKMKIGKRQIWNIVKKEQKCIRFPFSKFLNV